MRSTVILTQHFGHLKLSVIAHDVLEGKRERILLPTTDYCALTRSIRRLKVFMSSKTVSINP